MTTTLEQQTLTPVDEACDECGRTGVLIIKVMRPRARNQYGVRGYGLRRECWIRKDCTEAVLRRLAAQHIEGR